MGWKVSFVIKQLTLDESSASLHSTLRCLSCRRPVSKTEFRPPLFDCRSEPRTSCTWSKINIHSHLLVRKNPTGRKYGKLSHPKTKSSLGLTSPRMSVCIFWRGRGPRKRTGGRLRPRIGRRQGRQRSCLVSKSFATSCARQTLTNRCTHHDIPSRVLKTKEDPFKSIYNLESNMV